MATKRHFEYLAKEVGHMPYGDIEREDIIQMIIKFGFHFNPEFDPARFRDAVYESQSQRWLKMNGLDEIIAKGV